MDPAATGIDLTHAINSHHPLKYLYSGGFMCGGVAIGDIDNDGSTDLFFVVNDGPNRLYRQTVDWQFEDVSSQAGIGGGEDAWGAGAALVDIDADADLDIYVCNYRTPNQLFINEGVPDGEDSPRFSEKAAEFGLDISDASLMPSFCDYDHDGDLDVYIVCNRFYRKDGRPPGKLSEVVNGKPRLKPGLENYFRLLQLDDKNVMINAAGRRDYLLRNEGTNYRGEIKFVDVTEQSGIYGKGFGLSSAWWDYDDDGWPDLYVANDFENADRLYRNNGDGTFVDVIGDAMSHTSWFSMGTATGDINNDGLMDAIAVDMAGTSHYKDKMGMGDMDDLTARIVLDLSEPRQMMRNALYINSGAGRMMEAAFLAGVARSDWSWTPALVDFDNDGHLDLFISNGTSRDFINSDINYSDDDRVGKTEWELYEGTPPRLEQNVAYRNLGKLKFQDVSRQWGLAHVGMTFGTAYGDLDGDGDIDLVTANLDEPVSIYRNRSDQGHRVVVRLQGLRANRYAVGAQVRIETDAGIQVRSLHPMTGFLSSNQPMIHFGLGQQQTIKKLIVTWPGGRQQKFTDIPADHLITISEFSKSPTAIDSVATDESNATSAADRAPTYYRPYSALSASRHRETPYDDFQHQPLLPNKYSQLGPGMAWGDVDGDGDNDFFLGSGAGHHGRLQFNEENGFFLLGSNEAFKDESQYEDMAPLLFDADGDGDQDLYVVSGSYELPAESDAHRDRLYLNDGSGQFHRAPTDALPNSTDAGSVVAACDFDRDGDLDLFVGGRLVPQRFPVVPASRLLVNQSENDLVKFVDQTDELASSLARSGLVTSAVWSDADGDGWTDLLVTHEWGPIKFYRNLEGQLEDRTTESGLTHLLGWWNGIASGDFDNDGDMDYAVTNFGLNTKYKASPEKPVMAFYGDYAGDGTMRFVEAKYEEKTLFPVRGRSCSSNAMPHLRDKFGTFHEFAVASLADIYTPQCLADSHEVQVSYLESGVLINDGKASFRFLALPREAQISPSFGVVVTEINGDGIADIYIAHNFYTPQRETGRMDGGLSLALLGNGDGTFRPMPPAESGLIVPGDAKSLTVADLNRDNRPDFVVGRNNDTVVAFVQALQTRVLKISLVDTTPNKAAVGALVTLYRTDGSLQSAEVTAGGGYLSQSTAELFFGLGEAIECQRIAVRWPDGSSSEYSNPQFWSEGHCVLEKTSAEVN